MIKPRSISGIRTTKSSLSQNQLNFDSVCRPEEGLNSEGIRHDRQMPHSIPQSCINTSQLGDKK